MELPLTDRAKKKGVRSGVLSKLAFAKFEIPISHPVGDAEAGYDLGRDTSL